MLKLPGMDITAVHHDRNPGVAKSVTNFAVEGARRVVASVARRVASAAIGRILRFRV